MELCSTGTLIRAFSPGSCSVGTGLSKKLLRIYRYLMPSMKLHLGDTCSLDILKD